MDNVKSGLAAALLTCAVTAGAVGEIVPLRSISTVSSRYGMESQNIQVEARVANLAYDKLVLLHVKRWDGQWVDVPMEYQRPADNGHEIWSTRRDSVLVDSQGERVWDPEFTLLYVADGRTFVADNNGQPFRQPADSGNVLYGVHVYGGSYFAPTLTSRNGLVSGVATTAGPVQDGDSVTVVYSTDGWRTTQRAAATCLPYYWTGSYSGAGNPNAFGVREWTYTLPVGNATHVDYAIQYFNGGQTWWDNNYGRNYSSTIVPG